MTASLLSRVNSPLDLQELSIEELTALAAEIRQRIIEVMAVNGGHLASNLGVVELTLALHRAFASPHDKMIWDVSHQTYTHKIITGRNGLFGSIRQYRGLCGFSNPDESAHDFFHAGHAGTALSLALGLAKTRDLVGGDEYIIPIIGDATLTCGMTLEALNNLPRSLKRFIVVLNDNEMSISKNVGAVTYILNSLLGHPTTSRIHEELNRFLSHIPVEEAWAVHRHRVTESLKSVVSPAVYFEQYGLSYIGPIDGHDLRQLISTLEGVKHTTWPLVIHVLTSKGKGMPAAMENPVSYHGAKPFSRDTGKFLPNPSSAPTFPKVFGKHLVKMGEEDASLVVVTPAMLAGSCLDDFMEKFPERCMDVGIAEGHAVTFAGGLAYRGTHKVVVSIYSTFLQRAFDNLFHDICLQRLPVLFAIDRAGLSGPDGATHHGVFDLSFLTTMPNMVIAQPRNGQLLAELMESAFSWGKPCAIRYPNQTTEGPTAALQPRVCGKGEVLIQGSECLLIPLGHFCQIAEQISHILAFHGISSTVFDPIFIKPFDEESLTKLLDHHSLIVTLEEHSLTCGLGSIVNQFLFKSMDDRSTHVLNFGIPDRFIEHGNYDSLLDELGLTPEKIAGQILHTFQTQFTSLTSSAIR